MQKDWLEDLVVRETMKLIQDEAVIDKIVQLVMDVQNQENTTILLLEKQLREVNKKLDNLMKAIEDGLYTRTTKERLEALESQKDELTVKIADEKLKKPSFNEDFIRFWLMKFRKFDISRKKQRKALIEIFVNAIFLYDDRMLITFNYKDGTQTVRFEDTLTADCGEKSLRLRSNESHPVQADVVIGVPDSGLDAAIGYSRQSGIPYEIGFIKNKYIGRTFIAPGQKSREDKVRIKLNPISDVVRGKRVVLIDDSIVRGTTSARIVKLLRSAGATEIHMRISAPPFLNPCYYGTDIDSREHLIACHHSVEEISRIIGADSLGYLSVESAKRLACGVNGKGYCTACFDGAYPTEIPSETHKNRFEEKISKGKGTSHES